MSHIYDDYVVEQCSAPATSSPFDFSSGTTVPTGYQGFDASSLATNDTCFYTAVDGSGNREVGLGTWNETSKTLTRTTILSSTNADAAETFSGTVTVSMTLHAGLSQSLYHANAGLVPGGRLTLTSGTPVTTSDVTAATNVYYTPYTSNKITLWNSTKGAWETIEFAELTLALGTMTANIGYDIFAFISGGSVAIEKLAWTSDTVRATAITIQDGRYCKSGDKTRLFLGSFYSASTTTTEDSEANRLVFSFYNREPKLVKGVDATAHTYTTATERKWNNGTATDIGIFNGLPHSVPVLFGEYAQMNYSSGVGQLGYIRMGNSVTGYDGIYLASDASTLRTGQAIAFSIPAGYSLTYASEYGRVANCTFANVTIQADWPC